MSLRKLAGTELRGPGFPEWLDVEHPRHAFLSEEIGEAATEYGVADAQRIHATFETLTEALAAREASTLSVGVNIVKVPAAAAEESQDENPEPEPAPKAKGSK